MPQNNFKKAEELIKKYYPEPKADDKKSVYLHALRVGEYLKAMGYSESVITAGLLHDALEFSEITEQMIKEEFGENVLKTVKACTKDHSIEDSDNRIEELVKRSAAAGKDALIVRAADTLDSFKYYTETNNQTELDYCRKNADAILKYKPADIDDPIFEKLRELRNLLTAPKVEL